MTRIQYDLLSLIVDHTEYQNGQISRYWVPQEQRQWCNSLHRCVFVYGSGTVSSLKAMEKRGWIKAYGPFPYSYYATEDGSCALERHRELTGFYRQ
jgi:hypothetical protein